jgi:DNA-binding transcriptional ArsR family regulator
MATEQTSTAGVSDQRRLRALGSPLRIELIGVLRTLGPASIRELAAELDRPADGLYHHVRLLLKAGIVAEQAPRKHGRRMEAVYALTTSRIAGRLDPSSPHSKQGVIRAGTAAIRLAAREFAAAIQSDSVIRTNGLANVRASHQRAWLTDEGVFKLHRLFGQIEKLLVNQSQRKHGRRYSLTVVLAPLHRGRTKNGSS